MFLRNPILCSILIFVCPILTSGQTILNLDEETNLIQYPGTTLSCQVNLEGPGRLNIQLESWQSTTYPGFDFDRIYVYGPTMEPIGFENSTDENDPYLWHMLGESSNLHTPANQGGVYTIALHSGENYGWPSGQISQAYSILVSQVLVDDVFEPNDEIATAAIVEIDTEYEAYQWRSVGYGNVVTEDIDCYMIHIPTAGVLEILATNWVSTYHGSNGDYVYIYDAAGRRIYMNFHVSNDPIRSIIGEEGDYYLKFYSGDGISMDPYQVTFRFTENPEGTNITLHVPEEYGTIQEALNLADPGDTVLVQDGIYMENVSWPGTQGINLISANGPNSTVIDGNYDFSVIEFINMISAGADSTTLIQGFRLTHGVGMMGGGAINMEFEDHALTLRDVEIVDNSSDMWGGGIHVQGGTLNLENVVIANNYCMENGGGISLINCRLNAENLTVDGNRTDMSAAGIYAFDGDIHISQSTFHRNTSEMESTAIMHVVEEWVTHPIGNLNVTTSNFGGHEIAVNNMHNLTSQLEDNYWGDATGAFNEGENPSGQGEIVMGHADVYPWLASENVDAPMLPPATMSIDSSGSDYIAISWTPAGAADLAGYKVCYNTDQSGSPYSEVIDVGLSTNYTLININPNSIYHIAVRAFDTEGNQSWYTEEKSTFFRAVSVENLHLLDETNLQRVANQTPAFAYDYIDVQDMSQVSHHIQVSTDNTFSVIDMWDTGIVNNSTQNITYAGQPLLDGSTYHARVSAGDSEMFSDWTEVSFQMNMSPGQPTLIGPQDSIIIDFHPILSAMSTLDPDGDTLSYQFMLYQDINRNFFVGASPVIENVNGEFNWLVDSLLVENYHYFWTAGATDTYEWAVSEEMRSFIYDTQNDPPLPFGLITPRRNRETGLTPTFEWSDAIDPDPIETIVSYTLYIDSPVPGIQMYDVGTSTSFTLTEPLLDNREYFWKVAARDEEGLEVEDFESYRRFVTNTQNEDPSIAELLSPDSVIVLTLQPELHWTAVLDHDPNDMISYEVHWWRLGEQNQDSVLTAMNHTVIPNALEDNSEYNWMVISMDNSGGISHSEETSFWTDVTPEAPLGFALISPGDGASGLSRSPSFLWESTEDPDPLDFVTYTAQIALDSSFTNIVLETNELYHNGFELDLGNQLDDNMEYWWKVIAVDTDSLTTETEVFKFTVGTVSINEGFELPTTYILDQNYPNPFNPSTTIRYGLPEHSNVSLVIYDLRGNVVQVVESTTQDAGWYNVVWNGETSDGKTISTGIYFARLVVGDYSEVIKMLYLK